MDERICPDAILRQIPHSLAYSEKFFSLASQKKPHPCLGFLASHSGSSMQKIITSQKDGILPGNTKIVISNNQDAAALHYAQEHNIPTAYLSRKTHPDPRELDQAIAQHLAGCDWIILSGYMRPLGPIVIKNFSEKILNIHPSLLPNFGGLGMYGSKIHQAVINAHQDHSGITIHLVDDHYDTGPILAQLRVPLHTNDAAEKLETRIRNAEPDFFIAVLRKLL